MEPLPSDDDVAAKLKRLSIEEKIFLLECIKQLQSEGCQ